VRVAPRWPAGGRAIEAIGPGAEAAALLQVERFRRLEVSSELPPSRVVITDRLGRPSAFGHLAAKSSSTPRASSTARMYELAGPTASGRNSSKPSAGIKLAVGEIRRGTEDHRHWGEDHALMAATDPGGGL